MRLLRASVAVVALAATAAVSGCGTSAPTGTASAAAATQSSTGPVPSSTGGTPIATPPTPTASAGQVVNGVLTLGSADGGRFLTVPRGTIIEVALSANVGQPVYVWSDVGSSNQVVIVPRDVSTHSGAGAQASFLAAATGEAALSAHDDPTCTHNVPPCGVPSMLWTVTIAVG